MSNGVGGFEFGGLDAIQNIRRLVADNSGVTDRRAAPEILRALEVRPRIEPDAEIGRRVGFLREYLASTGERTLWLAVSGGVDSALCGRLCALAVAEGKNDGHRFVAVRLPYAVQRDAAAAERVIEWMRPTDVVRINIEDGVRGLEAALPGERLRARSAGARDFARGNTKARMRMAAQYHLANLEGGLVVGTDHAAEAVTGFFTKFGDGAADVTPLFGLTKRQVRRLATHLGLPRELVEKRPSADLEDLRPGLPDEDALGLTYDQIDDYLEGRIVEGEVADRIERLYRATAHKRRPPVTPGDRWWRPGAAASTSAAGGR